MRSRQYLVNLRMVQRTLAYRVYADRSVESGYLHHGEFERWLPEGFHTREYVSASLMMARDYGNEIRKEYL